MKRLVKLLIVTTVFITPQLLALTMSYEARGAARRYPFAQEKSLPPRLIAKEGLSYTSYLKYLVDLYEVIHFLETTAATSSDPMLKEFTGHGAERSEAIAADIAFLKKVHHNSSTPITSSQAARDYHNHLETLSSTQPHLLIGHLWVVYHYLISTGRSTAIKLHQELNIGMDGLNTYRYNGKLQTVRMSLRSHLDSLPLTHRQKREILDIEIEQASKALNRLLATSPSQ